MRQFAFLQELTDFCHESNAQDAGCQKHESSKRCFYEKIINRIKSCRNNTAECAEDCSEEKSSEVCARALRKRRLKTILRILLIVSALAVTAIIIFFAQFFKINEWQEFSADKILNSDRSVLIMMRTARLFRLRAAAANVYPSALKHFPNM